MISGNTSNPLTINPLTNVVYHVNGTDDLGCKSDASVFVKVVNSPEIHLPDQAYLCPGATITLNAGANDSTTYYWMGLPSDDSFLMVTYPGIYWVEAQNEGCAVSDTTLVEDGTVVWFPNAFTPFDDNGINDEFLAKSNTPLLSYHLFVFNRWGGLVFETQDINHGWDGTFEGKRCMGGMFVYKVIYTASHLCDDNKTTNDYHTGTIMLLE
jgi:gliding motility-associated-like protein